MLQEPRESQADWHFNFFGFRTRVAWGFWIVAALLGWSWSISVDDLARGADIDTPGAFVLLLIWILGVLLSILVHEWGHCMAFRYYGHDSKIVLYHFGGLAVPNSFGSWNGARQRHIGPHEQIVISAAGPAAQLALGVITWGIGMLCGVRMSATLYINDWLGLNLPVGEVPSTIVLFAVFGAIILPSVFWALINLVPVLPLDGGQIMRSLLQINNVRDYQRTSHLVSVIAGALVGLFLMQTGQFGGIMFFLLAASNWQSMQHPYGGF